VLLATGRAFDVLDVPPYAAAEARRRLRLTGYRLGPVAETGGGRLLIWTTSGARVAAELANRRPWPYGDLDLHCRSTGEYVMAPPSREASWIDPPIPYTHRVLPRCADILGTVADACRQAAAEQRRVVYRQRRSDSLVWPWRGAQAGPAGA